MKATIRNEETVDSVCTVSNDILIEMIIINTRARARYFN
jgi:hypothetical protein